MPSDDAPDPSSPGVGAASGACRIGEEPLNGELTRILREALRTIRFGTVTLVIQDGRVIQVDRNEKFRLKKPGHIDGCGI